MSSAGTPFMRAQLLIFITLSLLISVFSGCSRLFTRSDQTDMPTPPSLSGAVDHKSGVITLGDKQLQAMHTEPVSRHTIENAIKTYGRIDVNQKSSVPIWPTNSGHVVRVFANLNQDIKKGQKLFTLQSNEFIAAEKNMINAQTALDLSTKAFDHAKSSVDPKAAPSKAFDQAQAALATAQANYNQAKSSLIAFNQPEANIQTLLKTHKLYREFPVLSPVDGEITARNLQPGSLVQPNIAPAPYTVADSSTKWLTAYVTELEVSHYAVGQTLSVTLPSLEDKHVEAHIQKVDTTIDPRTRRMTVSATIADPEHELHTGMLALIDTSALPTDSAITIPETAVTHQSDGSLTTWIAINQHTFKKNVISATGPKNGMYVVSSGLQEGQTIATDGALLLSNIADN